MLNQFIHPLQVQLQSESEKYFEKSYQHISGIIFKTTTKITSSRISKYQFITLNNCRYSFIRCNTIVIFKRIKNSVIPTKIKDVTET